MSERRALVPFINLGHFLDHLVMLVFPTVVVALGREWNRRTGAPSLALGGFIAFGAFALPAGWLADHWSRYKMMAVFFFGIGVSMLLTGVAQSPWQIGAGLTLIGVFAAIYHPVGIAMLVASPEKMGRALGWNGLWGNLGLAAAALVAGALMDFWGWRAAFPSREFSASWPGLRSSSWCRIRGRCRRNRRRSACTSTAPRWRACSRSLIATACGGVIFNSTTVAMPKVFDERLASLTQTSFGIGALVAFVYSLAALAQLAMGSLIDRFELRKLMIGIALIQIPLLAVAANVEGWAMLAAALAMMLAVFGQIPLNDVIVGKYVADEYRARVLGALRGVARRRRGGGAAHRGAPSHRRRLQERVPRTRGAGGGDAARVTLLPLKKDDYASAVGCGAVLTIRSFPVNAR